MFSCVCQTFIFLCIPWIYFEIFGFVIRFNKCTFNVKNYNNNINIIYIYQRMRVLCVA
jgi:hypothetical protein